MKPTNLARRSMLFTPGNAAGRMRSAPTLDADSFVFDLEDAVPAHAKPDARRMVAEILPALDFAGRERVVRLNRLGSAESASDLAALPYGGFDTLLVPKVESAAEVERLDELLSGEEESRGLERGGIGLILSLETPRGFLNALPIADASGRCRGLFFGAGDYAAATGCAIAPNSLLWARSTLVAAASAAGCDAIDTPFFDVRDAEGTFQDATAAVALGFTGKGVFHPLQIEPINRAFTPTPGDLARAARVIAAFADMSSRGTGVAVVDGELVAIDVLPRLERAISLAAHVAARSSQKEARA